MQAHLLRTQQFIFLVLDIFFRFGVEKKNQLHSGKGYLIVLSANKIAECNRLKDKTNTVKHHCETSKCRATMWLRRTRDQIASVP